MRNGTKHVLHVSYRLVKKKQALCITSSNIVDHGEWYYSANCCSLTVILAIWNHPQHLSTTACHLCQQPNIPNSSRKPTMSTLTGNLQHNITACTQELQSSSTQWSAPRSQLFFTLQKAASCQAKEAQLKSGTILPQRLCCRSEGCPLSAVGRMRLPKSTSMSLAYHLSRQQFHQGHQRFTPEYVIKNQTKPHLRNYSFLHSHFLTSSQTKLLIPWTFFNALESYGILKIPGKQRRGIVYSS